MAPAFATARATVLAGFRAAGPDHRNCARSCLLFGLLRMDLDPELEGLARHLGGGVARQGLTCGILVGSALALGARDTYRCPSADPALAQEQLQRLIGSFIRRFGSASCSELTGCDLSTPEGLAAFRQEGRAKSCEVMLEWIFKELDGLLPSEQLSQG